MVDGERRGRPRTALGLIDPLIDEVIEGDPRDLGYRPSVWTAPLLQRYLEEIHKITVCTESVRLAIERLCIRWKRPRHHLARRVLRRGDRQKGAQTWALGAGTDGHFDAR